MSPKSSGKIKSALNCRRERKKLTVAKPVLEVTSPPPYPPVAPKATSRAIKKSVQEMKVDMWRWELRRKAPANQFGYRGGWSAAGSSRR